MGKRLLLIAGCVVLASALVIGAVTYVDTRRGLTDARADLAQARTTIVGLEARLQAADAMSANQQAEIEALETEREALTRRVEQLEAQVEALAAPAVEPTSAFLNLRLLQAGIRNFVRDLFSTYVCDDPTNQELEDWTAFVIRVGNRLQTTSGFGPDLALDTAMARAEDEMASSPEVEFLRENGACLPA